MKTIALILESNREYGRELLKGIARFAGGLPDSKAIQRVKIAEIPVNRAVCRVADQFILC